MVSPHFQVKTGSRAKGKSATKHFNYLCREGRKTWKRNDLVMVEHKNYPSWAKENPLDFWLASDSYERANGRVYVEYEVALPRELNRTQQIELIRDFVGQEWGNNHVYTWAFHCPKAMDGGDNPHFHLFFSERALDGISRSQKQFFMRANLKQPELGGNAKNRDWNRRHKVKELRMAWEASINRAFVRHNINKVVSLKSLAEQGIDRIPEPKLGARQTHLWKKGMPNENTELVRQLREVRHLELNLDEVFKDIDGTIRDLAKVSVEQSHQFIKIPANKIKSQVRMKKNYLYEQIRKVEAVRYELGLTQTRDGEIYPDSPDPEIKKKRAEVEKRLATLQGDLVKAKKFEKALGSLGGRKVAVRKGKPLSEKESLENSELFSKTVNRVIDEQVREQQLSNSLEMRLEPPRDGE